MFCLRFVVLVLLAPVCFSSDILAVLPTPSKSHFNVFQPLLLGLASRGHRVKVISSFPLASPVKNYIDISIKDFKVVYDSDLPFDVLSSIPLSFEENIIDLYAEISDFERVFGHPEVRKLLSSEEKFDLVITELWNTDMFLVFGEKFQAPLVVLSSCYLYPWDNPKLGLLTNPSYVPTVFMDSVGKLGFIQRLYNTYQHIVSNLVYNFYYNPRSEEILSRALGKPAPSLDELSKNISLLLVNTHHTLHGARPLTPNMVEIGGIHVQDVKPLPKDIKTWMDESEHGVIYFSFGSMVRGSSLPQDKVEALLQAFSTLPQRVMWKWEEENMKNLPKNVLVQKWLPQRDILGHPKCRVFITHGGLLGATEAVVSGVPLLGIPLFADQPLNIAAMVEQGAGLRLDFHNISVQSLTWALNTLLNNPRYAENARSLSQRFLDRPMSPLDTALYWVEYVLRHGGAPHLQPVAVHMSYLQLYLLDIIFSFILVTTLSLTVFYLIVRRYTRSRFAEKIKTS